MRHSALIIGRSPNTALAVNEQWAVVSLEQCRAALAQSARILRKISQVMVACGCLSWAEPAGLPPQ